MRFQFLFFLLIPTVIFGQTASDYISTGNVKLFTKDYNDAIIDFSKAIELDPKNERALFNRGMAKAGLEEHAAALVDYDKAIELNSKEQSWYYNRGLSKIQIKSYNEAVSDFDKAIYVSPRNSTDKYMNCQTYKNRAKAKFFLQNFNDALTDLSLAIESYPNDGEAYLLRGLCKIDLLQNEDGCKDLQKAVELDFTQAADLIKENCK